MTGDGDLRDELLAAIDGLDDTRAQTLLGWARVLGKTRKTLDEEHTVGALADMLGIVNELQEPGHARMRLDVDPAWHNPHGVLHGGVIYTMIDYCMGGAVMRGLPDGQLCTTIEIKVSYLASVRKGTLIAETNVVKQGRNIAFTESKVTDDQGRLVAIASGSMFILRPDAKE